MRVHGILKILGILTAWFSITLVPPIAISVYFGDGEHNTFLFCLLLIFFIGMLLWYPVRHYQSELRFREGFLIVVLIWVVLSMMAAVPLVLLDEPELSLVEAIFESSSGLTTTGATILTNIDQLPRSALYYRQQLQWLGGMGIIVLAVAVMPALGVGGMQLYRAETPGPMKDNKLTPRIKETAKAIWYIYLALTVVCGVAYFAAGMDWFNAICHAFSTIAIGGFSIHDDNLGYFQNNTIYLLAALFMILAGLNFALHFSAVRFRNVAVYLRDPEARAYIGIIFAMILLTTVMLVGHDIYLELDETVIQGIVQTVSMVTTTGFVTTDYTVWPTFIPILLVLLSAAGGCAGSTAGGIKVIRVLLLFKQGEREISKLVHPNALIPIKLGGRAVKDDVINAVWGFLSLYLFSYLVLFIMMLATGVDLMTAFSAVSACLNNLGPGLGDVAHDYSSITDTGKIILTFAMLLGRLELFTLLVLVSPVFWKG
ncbi:MAG: TrkH family potassium uptake protein [Gammaproteobacteria bacterium]|nr:TrkH family potassium uptake protein [Gammaproteobacteria bacterium]